MSKQGVLLGTLSLAVVATFLMMASHAQRSTQSAPALEESRWKERIDATGGVRAYEELSQSLAGATPEVEHESAHAFGGALYEVEGTSGLSVCDARFNFGCYHEFLGRAIAAQGLSAVTSLNDGCFAALTESPLSCQHGIGHGILAYLGYKEKDLIKALEQCAQVPHADPIGGCYGGLFMEYNLQTMLARQGRPRPLGADPLSPCNRLEEQYQSACYYWQPQWWAQVLRPGTVGDSAFTQMGEWCVQAGIHRRECFEGMGNITPPESEFDPAVAATLCDAASAELKDRLYCRSVAANSLTLGGAGKRGDGLSVCNGFSGRAYEYCAAYARNEANQVDRGIWEE